MISKKYPQPSFLIEILKFDVSVHITSEMWERAVIFLAFLKDFLMGPKEEHAHKSNLCSFSS